MKVLFLSTHLNAGGITSYLFTLAKGLIKQGHEVHVATSGGNMEKEFMAQGVKLLTVPIRTKSELSPKIYFVLPSLKKYICDHGIDLIHTQTRITQVMGMMLKKLTGRAHLSTCHGFFKTRLSRKLFPFWGDGVIAISDAVRRHLVDDFKVTPNKVFLIESGIDLDDFAPVSEEQKRANRKKYHLGDEPIVGLVARLSTVKGQDILIDAISKVVQQVPDVKLILVGEGKLEKALRDRAARLNLAEHVRFFTVVNRTQEMLPLFDIFAMPSRQEGLGLSLMEAQAAGLPVIASRVGGIPSLIENGKTGILIEPENSDVLASVIIDLLGDRAYLKKMGDAGRAFIQQTHSADKMTREVLNLYQKFVR